VLVLDLLLKQRDGIQQLLGPRRAPGHINVHRDDLIDTLHERVIIEHAPGGGAGAHGDDPFRLRHLSAPKRATSKRDAPIDIISIAQQARPKVIGQIEFFRTQLIAASAVVRKTPSGCSYP
jgi:hypothetical protein